MALIEWTDDLSVKIPSIDEQHKKLVGMINSLYEEISKGDIKNALVNIFEELVNYSVVHFGYEEILFDEFNYDDADTHIAEHEQLVKQVNILKNRLLHDKGFTLSWETFEFLYKWLTDHIMECDKAYSQFFVDKGVQ